MKKTLLCSHSLTMFQPALYTLLYVLSSLLLCSSFRPWPPYCRSHVNQRLAQDELEGQIHRLDNSNEITSTEIELLLLHTDIGESMKAQFPEAIANSEVKGRESVDSAMQRYQRLVQQMDRSDGRPDISFDTLSERYFEFIGTCIRTPGQAWMAAVAGLQYVGIFRDKFELDECGKYKIIDVAKLAYTSSRILLDLDGEKVKEIATVGDVTAQLKVQNLQLGLLRIAVRHAVAGENEEIADGVGLRIEYPLDLEVSAKAVIPSRAAVAAMIVLDMDITFAEDEATGAFIVETSEVQAWKERVKSFSP